MADLLDLLEATAANWLALFRRYLDDAAQLALTGEIAELVLQAPWFVPRTPRSGKAFSVKMLFKCCCVSSTKQTIAVHPIRLFRFTYSCQPQRQFCLLESKKSS
jgi:alkylated DNA repair dioxygenase AlkB